MKTIVTMVLAVLAAASTVTAQDTLLLRSYRTIDVCSSEQRWLIAPYLGNIRSTDSLASFDITIGFDTTVLRPTDVLTENTLSFLASYPAQMTLVIPGEMRIAGFNITRNMVGDKPLFAVAGDYIGSCTDSVVFTFPWPPTFNEEFKKNIRVLTSEHVAVIAQPRLDTKLGVEIEQDSVTLDSTNASVTVTSSLTVGTKVPPQGRLHYWVSDSSVVQIDSVSFEGDFFSNVVTNKRDVTMDVKLSDGKLPAVRIHLRSNTTAVSDTATLMARLDIVDTCSCVRSGRVDSVNIQLTNSIVSVSSPVDDSNERLVVTATNATCHCYHGQTNEISVFSTTGERVATQHAGPRTENTMSLEYLPPGPYIIVGTCGTKRFVNLNLK